jgi:hypothetical protein
MLIGTRFKSNLSMIANSMVLLGKQYWSYMVQIIFYEIMGYVLW